MNETLRPMIEKAAELLRQAGAREVYVFGSAARATDRRDSDIDLAVRGLPPQRFFATMAQLDQAIDRPFDLVDLDVESPFTEYLVTRGKLLRVA